MLKKGRGGGGGTRPAVKNFGYEIKCCYLLGFWIERAHPFVDTCIVSLFACLMFVCLFVYGFAIFVMHEVTSHRRCRNVESSKNLKFREFDFSLGKSSVECWYTSITI